MSSISANSFFSLTTRFRALRHRNFQLFVIGQLISLIGTWMQNAAQQWLVYEKTSSAALLGVFGFASQVPMLLLAWMGGYVGDRYSRHRGVIATQSLSMVCAFLLAALTLAHVIQTWHLIFIAFIVGIINAFDVPIRQSFFVHMVDDKQDLPNAIALNSSIFNGARIIGPPLAGFAIAYIGAGWCFFLNGFSFIAVLVALLMMQIPKSETRYTDESPIRAFGEGFRFAMTDVPIRSALLLLSTLSLFGLQYSVFLPIYARDILHGDAKTFGLLMSAAGVGAFLGALQFAARTNYKGLARWIGATCTVCALGLLVISQATSFWLCAAVLFVVGFAATSQMAATNTIIQQRVPDEMRSRLMAVYATLFMGVMPIGSLFAGFVAKHLGAPHALLLLGIMVLIGCGIFLFRVILKVKPQQTTVAGTIPSG
ncbi:MAG TPA: MFS transporter [Dongiaceae bacterium]|nr:MFS transporter [Dongiaceae bacterium]